MLLNDTLLKHLIESSKQVSAQKLFEALQERIPFWHDSSDIYPHLGTFLNEWNLAMEFYKEKTNASGINFHRYEFTKNNFPNFKDLKLISADFSNAIFNDDIDFSCRESFHGNKNEPGFSGNVDFSNVTFKGKVKFSGTIFPANVDFSNAVFRKDVNFSDALFLGDTNFQHTQFCGKVDFKRVKAKCYIDFGYTNFQNFADFSHIECDWVPNFRLCSFNKKISLNGFKFPKTPPEEQKKYQSGKLNDQYTQQEYENLTEKDKLVKSDFPDRYRVLKLMAQNAGDQDTKLRAFASEMRAKRFTETTGVALIPNYLYEWLSNYGQSLLRPLIWFSLLTYIFFLSYIAYLHKIDSPSIYNALLLTLHTLLPFGSETARDMVMNYEIDLPIIFGKLLSFPLLFLFGLAVRNRFLMK